MLSANIVGIRNAPVQHGGKDIQRGANSCLNTHWQLWHFSKNKGTGMSSILDINSKKVFRVFWQFQENKKEFEILS